MAEAVPALPVFERLLLARHGRVLQLALHRPDRLNAVDLVMHDELPEALAFVRDDPHSDVIVLTGSGAAFSAGGDLAHIEANAENPDQFDHEARQARRIVMRLLDIDKPVVCRLNGHAIGLGATLALLCDVVFAAQGAKIGDPHVRIGLVAGDGGVLAWVQRIGPAAAKRYLLTGDTLTAQEAEAIGLVNFCVPAEQLDQAVDDFCDRLLAGAQSAIRWTKLLANGELKRAAGAIMEAGMAYEALSVRSADHREGIRALRERRPPSFGK